MLEKILAHSKFVELVEGEFFTIPVRYVRFVKDDKANAGFVKYDEGWKMWVWEPKEGYKHSSSCLLDIVGFVNLLNREFPEGKW